jgi:hypothetical protein
MIDMGDILGPCATLLAVSLAVFVFTLPRSLTLYRERMSAYSDVDVPDSIKKRCLFRFFVFGDGFLLMSVGGISLILGVLFVIIMSQTIGLYLGSSTITIVKILENFDIFLLILVIVLIALLVASLALFTTEILVSEKRLPLLARVYAHRVLGRSSSTTDTNSLLPKARDLYIKEAFGDSVLHSVAALEIALRDRFDLPERVGFGRLIGEVSEKLERFMPIDTLIEIRRIRNIAAHPSPESQVTEEDAKHVLELVEDILSRIDEFYTN